MLVVIANYLPPAVRGRMKLWFIEPKANVFVSGVKDSVADDVVSYLHKHCPENSGLIVFKRTNRSPGFRVYSKGEPLRSISEYSGLQLILEKSGCVEM